MQVIAVEVGDDQWCVCEPRPDGTYRKMEQLQN